MINLLNQTLFTWQREIENLETQVQCINYYYKTPKRIF